MSTQSSNMDNSIQDMFSTSELFSDFEIEDDYENLRVIFEEVLCSVSFVDVEENVFKDEVPKLKSACADVHSKINEMLQNNEVVLSEVQNLLQRYIDLLKLAYEAVNYISNRVQFMQVQSLPLAVGEILLQTFKHCKESDTVYGNNFASLSSLLTALYRQANDLQKSYLNLINNVLIYDLTEENQICFLTKVTELLSAVGEIVSSLDIKSAAEIWKAYIVLSQTHNEHLKTRVNVESVLKYFSSEITIALENIMKMTDMKNIEKLLKISSFNLKIIIKLCGLYSDNLGDSYDSLFHLLIALNKCSIPFLQYKKLNPKFIDSMQVYVTVASEPLLNSLLSDRQFIQYYFKNIDSQLNDDTNRLSAVFMSISVMKKILTSDVYVRRMWISKNPTENLLSIAFSSLDQLHAEFSLVLPIAMPSMPGEAPRVGSLYEFYLVNVVAVVVSLDATEFKELEKILVQALMQDNMWKAEFAADVWCIVARYGSADFCYKQLQSLIKILITVEKNRIQKKYLSSIIYRLYSLLTNKYKTELVKQYPIIENPKIWAVLGIRNDSVLINEIFNVCINKIDKFIIDKWNTASYISMYNFLELVSTCSLSETNDLIAKNLASRVTKLWSLNFDREIIQSLWCLKFMRILCQVSSSLMKYFTNADLLQILKTIVDTCQSEVKIKFSITEILNSLAVKTIEPTAEQYEIFENISSLFKTLLKDNNPIVKQATLEAFSYFAYHTKHENILANVVENEQKLQDDVSKYLQKITTLSDSCRESYFKSQRNLKLHHKCNDSLRTSEPRQKKKKLVSNADASVVIQRLKFDCDTLVECCKNEGLTNDLSVDVSVVISKLQNLLKK